MTDLLWFCVMAAAVLGFWAACFEYGAPVAVPAVAVAVPVFRRLFW